MSTACTIADSVDLSLCRNHTRRRSRSLPAELVMYSGELGTDSSLYVQPANRGPGGIATGIVLSLDLVTDQKARQYSQLTEFTPPLD